jgi:hypothetical protein
MMEDGGQRKGVALWPPPLPPSVPHDLAELFFKFGHHVLADLAGQGLKSSGGLLDEPPAEFTHLEVEGRQLWPAQSGGDYLFAEGGNAVLDGLFNLVLKGLIVLMVVRSFAPTGPRLWA